MKKLKAFRHGQERYEHNGKIYSIVDLCAWPEKDIPKPIDSHWDKFVAFYKPFNFELAEQSDKGIDVFLDRFKSFDEAKEFIRGLK